MFKSPARENRGMENKKNPGKYKAVWGKFRDTINYVHNKHSTSDNMESHAVQSKTIIIRISPEQVTE
jgi:hypothetical protein